MNVSSLALFSVLVHTSSQAPAVLVSVVVSWLSVLWVCGWPGANRHPVWWPCRDSPMGPNRVVLQCGSAAVLVCVLQSSPIPELHCTALFVILSSIVLLPDAHRHHCSFYMRIMQV